MKFNFAAFLGFVCLQSHATIIQQHVIVDAPVVSVLAGEQQNGNIAIEQLFTNNTTSAQDALSSSFISSGSTPSFGGSSQRSVPAAFSAQPENLLPPVINPITPPVPEPETYALMAIGLTGLLLARRQRKSSSRTDA